MLQRFSTGLISGEFGGQHVFSIKFGTGLFLHHAWVALAACASAPSWTKVSLLLRRFVFRMAEASAKRVTGDEPQGTMGRVQRAGEIFIKRETSGYEAGRTSCGDWNWTIFARLLLHSHFYGEGRASLLSLICCWCSNRQSKSVLGVKSISQWDRSLSFLPNDPFWTFFYLDMLEELGYPENPNNIIFWIGQLKKIFGTIVRKKKIIPFFRSEVFVLLSKFQSSGTLLGCKQRILLPSQRSPTFALHKPPDGVFSPNMAFAC